MDAGPMTSPETGALAGAGARTGVLLVNLGTPDGTGFVPMWRYLREFLMDRRVIEWPRSIWYPILFGIVLNTRPRKSGHAYETIWNRELDESPLRTCTRSQAGKLAEQLADLPDVAVYWAMRYGRPSIAAVLDRMLADGCRRVVMIPLYPQYSASTTATVNDKLFDALKRLRWQPALRIAPPWYDDPLYIEALARSIETHIDGLGYEPEVVIASYHGIPVSYSRKGDPYREQCLETTRLLRQRLGWGEDRLISCFQSRFGPEEWLQPYTDETVARLGREGVRSVAVFNPGFVADCLETLEEIAIAAGNTFREAGGERFSHIPCLNDGPDGMAVIERIARRELSGWA